MNATDTPVVELVSLTKRFGAQTVLNSVNLKIGVGQKVVICGPSGSGKSTLIRCINGLEDIDGGEVIVRNPQTGERYQKPADVRRHVGMVFQSFNLFPHYTVLKNCMLAPVKVNGVSKDEAREIATRLLTKVRVANQAGKYPPQLSGGQQQRVAIARALCMSPSVMLFDEPTSALDPEMVKEVLDTMVALATEGMTMLCVTHEMSFARRVADRIIFVDGGRILVDASPDEFFSDAAHPRVREFLGQVLAHA
ncbi:glutamine ABC transporter ATP-binding protein (plasmid) [Paraburkholderia caffeinilytica]|uniref:Glutamine transport ATP-binding protein GlnQ n=2 Tax=Paraburkholderia TaxID=1822464 RepID=A0A6J5FJI1_9BURK|nr:MULTISPECIES: amino acid ABC transporter ATP-binding protein [Paraburkholderia]AXL53986.1 glutamine ABC transporter ATP-binding protein [Paraburkholderia caffeinilytica]GGC65791.1 ABC transporter ATP-binding protein [Paraburkholderia caffeinilytica]CAB3781699.1 Glutamine transport ATP-binding protein GlnQ [Paraburkholderia caffeinitolerans]CAB3802033.1 Glutamine transport ATP-binding protein GlnQ [Paraburkholderia caffeinilytica]